MAPRTPIVLAALALLASAAAAPSRAGAQVVNAEAQAQVRFARGRELFLARSFEQALAEFRAANSLVASPNTRLYIARCLRELGRNAEALVEFQRAAGEASDRAASEPRYAATRDTARAEGAAVMPRVGRLTLRVPAPPDGARVTVSGVQVSAAGWDTPTPVDAGEVEVVASAPGHREFRQRVAVGAGQDVEVTVMLPVDPDAAQRARQGERAEQPPPRRGAEAAVSPPPRVVGGEVRIAGVVVASAGAVLGGVAFAVFGSLAQNRFNDLQTLCGEGQACPASLDSQIAEGEGYQTAANASLIAGAVLVAAGAVMIAAGGPRTEGAPGGVEAGARRVRVAPAFAWGAGPNGGAFAGVRGAF